MGILANFIYSFSHWINKPLLLIVTHNFVIGLVSKGLTMALGACVFIKNLNMVVANWKDWHFNVFELDPMKISPYLIDINVS
jgi:hypothetical protein